MHSALVKSRKPAAGDCWTLVCTGCNSVRRYVPSVGGEMHDFEIRLLGHQSDAGQILAQDMVNLAEAAQSLITRIARAAVDRRGPGRSESALEQLSRVRLTGLSTGSTVVSFSFGDQAALDIDDPVSDEIDKTFWLITSGLEANNRPPGITDSVAAAVNNLIGALRHAAPLVEVGSHQRRPVQLKPQSLSREIWQSGVEVGDTLVTYIGVLEMLDLRNGVFRIADDVANRIVLRDVRSPHEAARLVDRRVRVTGQPAFAADGALRHLTEVGIEGVDLPASWSADLPDLAQILRTAPGPSTNGGLDLTEEEFESFLAAVHG